MADQPPRNGNVRFILIDSYSESSGRSSGRSPPKENGDLRLIQITALRAQADQLADLPPTHTHTSRGIWWKVMLTFSQTYFNREKVFEKA